MAKKNSFLKSELEALISRYSRENESGTPDVLWAEYLMGCLEAFEKTTRKRDTWYKNSQDARGRYSAESRRSRGASK